jgi:hypothetical protein
MAVGLSALRTLVPRNFIILMLLVLLANGYRGLSPGIKRQGPEANR